MLVELSPPSHPPYLVLAYATKGPRASGPLTSLAGATLRVSLQGMRALLGHSPPTPPPTLEVTCGQNVVLDFAAHRLLLV